MFDNCTLNGSQYFKKVILISKMHHGQGKDSWDLLKKLVTVESIIPWGGSYLWWFELG